MQQHGWSPLSHTHNDNNIEWKYPEPKEYTLYGSIYINFKHWKKQVCGGRSQENVGIGGG